MSRIDVLIYYVFEGLGKYSYLIVDKSILYMKEDTLKSLLI